MDLKCKGQALGQVNKYGRGVLGERRGAGEHLDRGAWLVVDAGSVQRVQRGGVRDSEVDSTFGQVPKCLAKIVWISMLDTESWTCFRWLL